MKQLRTISLMVPLFLLTNCGNQGEKQIEKFKIQVGRFADIEILRYRVTQFEQLSLRQKKLVYFLSQAALSGRDILYDQNYKYLSLIVF